MNFEEIATRVRAGDRMAEEQVVRWFERPVRAYVMVNTGDACAAEELAQEVLLAVVCALREGRVEQPAQLPAFVRGAARNLIHNHIRSQVRRRTTPLTDDLAGFSSGHETFERNYAARQAIATLEKHEQEVLILSLVEGLVPDEVAKRLRITPQAVRQRKFRALRRLGEILRPPSRVQPARLLKE